MARQPSLNRVINNIITDARKTTKAALEYAGQKVSDDLGKMAYLALDHYYSTHDPEYYKRLYTQLGSLYNTPNKVNKRNGFSVTTGIIFEPNTMSHLHRGIPESAIFKNFLVGEHGWKHNEQGEWELITSEINYKNEMDKYYKNYINDNIPYNYFKEYMDSHLKH